MVVGAYFTNWSVYARQFQPADLPLDVLMHVFYAFAKPDPASGAITLSDEYADLQKPLRCGGQGAFDELNILKQRHNFRILLSVGGFTYANDFATCVRSVEKRDRFVSSLVELVKTHRLDGVDLDWEYPSTLEDRAAYIDLVRELRAALPTASEISVAIPGGDYHLQWFDLMGMDPYVSFWNVMAYDFAGPWSPVAQHHAALVSNDCDCVVRTVDRLLSQISSDKIVLGIPLYGRSFANTTSVNQPFQGAVMGSFEMGVHDVKDLPLEGYTEYTDRDAGAVTATDGRNLVSYDNALTIQMKARYCQATRLGGAFFWEASGDRKESLIRVFADHWR